MKFEGRRAEISTPYPTAEMEGKMMLRQSYLHHLFRRRRSQLYEGRVKRTT